MTTCEERVQRKVTTSQPASQPPPCGSVTCWAPRVQPACPARAHLGSCFPQCERLVVGGLFTLRGAAGHVPSVFLSTQVGCSGKFPLLHGHAWRQRAWVSSFRPEGAFLFLVEFPRGERSASCSFSHLCGKGLGKAGRLSHNVTRREEPGNLAFHEGWSPWLLSESDKPGLSYTTWTLGGLFAQMSKQHVQGECD